MNKNSYKMFAFATLMAGGVAVANAQSVYESVETLSVTEFTCDPANHYYSNWRNNWFIQLGAGVDQPFVERGSGASGAVGPMVDRHKMTAVYNFGFGHWFSPYLALRINAMGGAVHWNNPTDKAGTNGWSRAKNVTLSGDLMWDMLNSICGVNTNRVFSLIPYVGVGGNYMWDYRNSGTASPAGTNVCYSDGTPRSCNWTLPVSAGLQLRFRLCKYVDFFAEIRSDFYGDNWNLCATGDAIEANVSCYGGLSFNIGERDFGDFNECNYLSKIASLNNDVNTLRAQLLASSQAIAELEAQLPCPEVRNTIVINEESPLLATVRFTIGSDVISPEEMVNVYNMSDWMKSNPDVKVTINGYADKDTGTAAFNLALSKRRAEKVYDVMTNYYGIPADRLTVKYEGSNVQPYDVNNWNRIVVFTLDK